MITNLSQFKRAIQEKKKFKVIEHNVKPEYIGSSDIASLTVRTPLCAYVLNFGKDGSYYAYIVNDNVDIPDHYYFVCHGEKWLRIYDDTGMVKIFRADEIRIYRAATMGCIIQLRNFNKEN